LNASCPICRNSPERLPPAESWSKLLYRVTLLACLC
jgi:hypothetical protein